MSNILGAKAHANVLNGTFSTDCISICIRIGLTENVISPEPNLCCYKLNILDLRLHSPQSVLFRCQISSMHSSTRKTLQKRTLKRLLRHLLVNLKNVRVLAPPTLFRIKLWRQWQPLIFPLIQASDGALRSVKHECRNVVIRVRGCRMSKIQE